MPEQESRYCWPQIIVVTNIPAWHLSNVGYKRFINVLCWWVRSTELVIANAVSEYATEAG